MNRRDFLRNTAFTLVAVSASGMIPKFSLAKEAGKGTISKLDLGDAIIHTYTAPPSGFYVTSHIIEGPNKLVVIDTQQFTPHTKEVKDYILSLNKPVERILISHHHPDHTFGLNMMQEWHASARPAVVKNLEKRGPFYINLKKPKLGDWVPDVVTLPQGDMQLGEQIIDGIRYNIEEVSPAEASDQVFITLPDYDVLIAQDLVFNNVHGFVGIDEIPSWIKVLEDLSKRKDIKHVLCGHGEPGGPELIPTMIDYLKVADKEIKNAVANGKDLRPAMTKAFPTYRGEGVLNISNKMLFKKKKK